MAVDSLACHFEALVEPANFYSFTLPSVRTKLRSWPKGMDSKLGKKIFLTEVSTRRVGAYGKTLAGRMVQSPEFNVEGFGVLSCWEPGAQGEFENPFHKRSK